MGGRSGQAIKGISSAQSPKSQESKNDSQNNDYKKADFILGGIDKKDAKNYASIAGVPSGFDGEITVVKRNANQIEVYVSNQDITLMRKIDPIKKLIENELFVIKVSKSGVKKYDGSDTFTNQINQARKAGYLKITTEAASGKSITGVKFNGYYTWLRLGYKPDAKTDKKYTEKFNNQTGSNIKSVTELMYSESGRSWWKKNGGKFKGEFDLSTTSESSKTLNNYNKK